jgi:hypothetical protein
MSAAGSQYLASTLLVMPRSRDPHADDVRRAALRRRVDRLKVASWAVAAGAWLALWTLVTGAVAGTAAPPSLPALSRQESPTVDLFGQGSRLGASSGTPVLRSSGS